MSEEDRVIGSASIHVDKSLRIEFKVPGLMTKYGCCLCNSGTEKWYVYAMAYIGDTELGFACEDCMKAGLEGIPGRIRERCGTLLAEYTEHLELLLNCHNTKELPTLDDWKAANDEAYFGPDGPGGELEYVCPECKATYRFDGEHEVVVTRCSSCDVVLTGVSRISEPGDKSRDIQF